MGCSISIGAVVVTCLTCHKFIVPAAPEPDTYGACKEALDPNVL